MLLFIIGILASFGLIALPIFVVILLSNLLEIVSYKIHVTDKQKFKIITSTTVIIMVFAALLATIAFK